MLLILNRYITIANWSFILGFNIYFGVRIQTIPVTSQSSLGKGAGRREEGEVEKKEEEETKINKKKNTE